MLKENCPNKRFLGFFCNFLLYITLACFLIFLSFLIYLTEIFPCHFMCLFLFNAKMSLLSDIHEMVAEVSGNKSCSFILFLVTASIPAIWLLYPFCTKKKIEKKNFLWSSTHPVAVNQGVKAHWGPQERLRLFVWEMTRHNCTESSIASLHYFSIHCGEWIMVLKMHLFFEGRKKAIQTKL